MNNELKIARYYDGTMTPEERQSFLAEAGVDPELEQAIKTETVIQDILRTDAGRIGEISAFDSTPGAPLLERLAITSASKSKVLYYLLGIAAVIAVVAFFLFRSGPQPPITTPVPVPMEQPAPQLQVPSEKPVTSSPEVHDKVKTETGKVARDVKPQQKDVDLDQDLKGKPKVFTDPKGHMPIK